MESDPSLQFLIMCNELSPMHTEVSGQDSCIFHGLNAVDNVNTGTPGYVQAAN